MSGGSARIRRSSYLEGLPGVNLDARFRRRPHDRLSVDGDDRGDRRGTRYANRRTLFAGDLAPVARGSGSEIRARAA
jgi:hypothetical protein